MAGDLSGGPSSSVANERRWWPRSKLDLIGVQEQGFNLGGMIGLDFTKNIALVPVAPRLSILKGW